MNTIKWNKKGTGKVLFFCIKNKIIQIILVVIKMCTCINLIQKNNNYFARSLDSIDGYSLKPVIVPRNYNVNYKISTIKDRGFSIIGMGIVKNEYPLLAEGLNEHGLAIAGLEHDGYAYYNEIIDNKINIPSYEFILFILRQCKSLEEAKKLIRGINIIGDTYCGLKAPMLHWMISYKNESIVVESTEKGIIIYDNPYHVMTNNPYFSYHLENIKNYCNLTSGFPKNKFIENVDIKPNSNGAGLLGIPGDYQSSSRFIKASFLVGNANDILENEVIPHAFSIIAAVSPLKGTSLTFNRKNNYTIYSSVMDCNNLKYYYKTYNSLIVVMISLKNLMDESKLITYDLKSEIY